MQSENILSRFQATAEVCGEMACFRFKKDNVWHSVNWKEALAGVVLLSEAFKKSGVGAGDRVAILSRTRYEWALHDAAIMSLGAVTVPIHHNDTLDSVEYILSDSGSQMIMVEDASQLKKVLAVRHLVPDLKQIILLEGSIIEKDVINHEDFLNSAKGIKSDFDVRIRNIKGDQLASIVYTSGTSGKPKGVMLTHENFLAEEKALMKAIPVKWGDTVLGFLPLAHVLGRVLQWYQLTNGLQCAYAENMEKLGENILDIRPHTIACVPLLYETIFNRIMARVQEGSSLQKKIFNLATRVGKSYSRCLQNKQPIPAKLKIKYMIASRLVFSKIRKQLGGRLRFLISGGAPLSRDICEFFHGAGLLILEGYGLTETSAAVNVTTLDAYCFGSVGKPMPGVEERIAEDGEILVRGPMVAEGYWNQPAATAEAFDKDGWFHTGDIGEFDDHGFLKITDRKKDIIVTAGGKNIAPQNIENLLKTHPLISQVVVHGDKRKFLSALITLHPEELSKQATKLGIAARDPLAISKDPKMKELVQGIIAEFNKKLASYETIRTYAVLEKALSVEGGELTPTLKVKRKVINEKFQYLLDQLYESPVGVS